MEGPHGGWRIRNKTTFDMKYEAEMNLWCQKCYPSMFGKNAFATGGSDLLQHAQDYFHKNE